MDSVPARVLQTQIAHAIILLGAREVVNILRFMADAVDVGFSQPGDLVSPVAPCAQCPGRDKAGSEVQENQRVGTPMESGRPEAPVSPAAMPDAAPRLTPKANGDSPADGSMCPAAAGGKTTQSEVNHG